MAKIHVANVQQGDLGIVGNRAGLDDLDAEGRVGTELYQSESVLEAAQTAGFCQDCRPDRFFSEPFHAKYQVEIGEAVNQ